MRRPVSLGAKVRTTVSTSGNSGTRLRVHQNVVPFHLDGEGIQLDGRVEIVFSSAAIVRPLMPWTGDQVVLQSSLPDGAAGMRTDARERMQAAVRVADRVGIIAQNDFHHRARRERSD